MYFYNTSPLIECVETERCTSNDQTSYRLLSNAGREQYFSLFNTRDRIVLFNVFAAVTAVILKSEHRLVFQCPILKCMNQEERHKEMNFKMTGILRQVLPQIQI